MRTWKMETRNVANINNAKSVMNTNFEKKIQTFNDDWSLKLKSDFRKLAKIERICENAQVWPHWERFQTLHRNPQEWRIWHPWNRSAQQEWLKPQTESLGTDFRTFSVDGQEAFVTLERFQTLHRNPKECRFWHPWSRSAQQEWWDSNRKHRNWLSYF